MLAENLHRIRTEKHISQEELGRLTDIAQPRISEIERGIVRNPSVRVLRALNQKLGVTLDELLG